MTAVSPLGPYRVVLRADASRQIGVGHVMRSLALGKALVSAGANVTLLSTRLDNSVRHRPALCGVDMVMCEAEPGGGADADAVAGLSPDLAVLDGYFFTPEFEQVLESRRVPTMVIDDNGETPVRSASIVLNQNPHARAACYEGEVSAGTTLLLGPRYTLVRHEVCERASRAVAPPQTGEVLVAIGGTDVLDLTGQLVQRLAGLRGVSVTAPALAPHRLPGPLPEIVDQLARSCVAVISAGSMLWEACALGVPAVALVVADNQVSSALAAQESGAAVVVDCRVHLPLDDIADAVSRLVAGQAQRHAMAAAGRRLVDCRGTDRVTRAVVARIENRVAS